MSRFTRKADAVTLANSMRGQYIISQALYLAVRELKKVPEGRREVSNIMDMELLLEECFPMFPALVRSTEGREK